MMNPEVMAKKELCKKINLLLTPEERETVMERPRGQSRVFAEIPERSLPQYSRAFCK